MVCLVWLPTGEMENWRTPSQASDNIRRYHNVILDSADCQHDDVTSRNGNPPPPGPFAIPSLMPLEKRARARARASFCFDSRETMAQSRRFPSIHPSDKPKPVDLQIPDSHNPGTPVCVLALIGATEPRDSRSNSASTACLRSSTKNNALPCVVWSDEENKSARSGRTQRVPPPFPGLTTVRGVPERCSPPPWSVL